MMDIIDVSKVTETKVHERKGAGEVVLELVCGRKAAPACFIFRTADFATFVNQLVRAEGMISRKCGRA